ncbi:glycine-rich domain-containing protein [Ralstonia sp. 24A2]|uniref:glycine-rich domain-containing protein n=1 Tax=Ralstonia sp. 24A2 TaxID=3447364 RepID=UPI003F6A1D63
MAVVGSFFGLFVAGIAILVLRAMFNSARRKRRETYIQNYAWPPGLLERFAEKHPALSPIQREQVVRGLRQFFIVHLRSDCDYVSMPSRVVDDLWHEFILYTREYRDFCRQAFGKFLDHLPSAALSPLRKQSNIGLRRTWWWACKDEAINPRKPKGLPLLFAIDHQLAIPNGFYYVPDCATILPGGEVRQCGADFANRRIDGSIEGFGTSTRRRSSSGGGGGGGDGCSSCSSCSSCSGCSGSSSSD